MPMTRNQLTVLGTVLFFLLGLIAVLFGLSWPAEPRSDSGFAIAGAVLLGSLIIAVAILASRR